MHWKSFLVFATLSSSVSFGQDSAFVQVPIENYTINFPATPEFSIDTSNSESAIIYTNYSLTANDSLSFFVISRERIPEDNKKETFQNEQDQLGYWTLAQISEQKKGRKKGSSTLEFTAKTRIETYYFLLVLTKTHFIKIGVATEDDTYKDLALAFIASFDTAK